MELEELPVIDGCSFTEMLFRRNRHSKIVTRSHVIVRNQEVAHGIQIWIWFGSNLRRTT